MTPPRNRPQAPGQRRDLSTWAKQKKRIPVSSSFAKYSLRNGGARTRRLRCCAPGARRCHCLLSALCHDAPDRGHLPGLTPPALRNRALWQGHAETTFSVREEPPVPPPPIGGAAIPNRWQTAHWIENGQQQTATGRAARPNGKICVSRMCRTPRPGHSRTRKHQVWQVHAFAADWPQAPRSHRPQARTGPGKQKQLSSQYPQRKPPRQSAGADPKWWFNSTASRAHAARSPGRR